MMSPGYKTDAAPSTAQRKGELFSRENLIPFVLVTALFFLGHSEQLE